MDVLTKKELGDQGEQDVIDLVPCPNCGSKLMKLPRNYPLVDLQCTACTFRVQVKRSSVPPEKAMKVQGGGWHVLNHALKVGMVLPPLIVNFNWLDTKTGEEKREIRFYPFVWKKNIMRRTANILSVNRVHEMVDYSLRGLVYYKLFPR